MKYVIAIEPGNENQAWGVVVPDLPGCFSAGDSMSEAVDNAREAIALHLEDILDQGQPLPEAQDLDVHIQNAEYREWLWAIVDLPLEELDDKVERVNITVPSRVLRVVDRAAKAAGENRSSYLVMSAMAQARGKSSDYSVVDLGDAALKQAVHVMRAKGGNWAVVGDSTRAKAVAKASRLSGTFLGVTESSENMAARPAKGVRVSRPASHKGHK